VGGKIKSKGVLRVLLLKKKSRDAQERNAAAGVAPDNKRRGGVNAEEKSVHAREYRQGESNSADQIIRSFEKKESCSLTEAAKGRKKGRKSTAYPPIQKIIGGRQNQQRRNSV